jgi:hypothetical protein
MKGWERAAVGAALAALAARALDDAFLSPARGTGAGDHLVPGLGTLAVLAAAAVVLARARPGAQAAAAIVLGVLALEGAGLAVVGFGDWTGFVLAPAGVALVVVGALVLRRTRKPGRLRHLRRAALVLAGAVAAYWAVFPLALAIAATHRPRQTAPAPPRGFEAVTLHTRDGLALAAWYARSRNGAAVVSYPTRQGKLPQARMLARHGYGVLLVDARGYDGSEGAPNAFGWGEAPDLDAAAAWLARQPDVRDGRIGGMGFSVGGEMLLEAASRNRAIRAVVSEGAGIRSLREPLLYGPRGWLSLPAYAVQTAALAILSGHAPPPALDDVVARIAPRPVLLVFAGRGTGGEELNPDFAGPSTRVWRVDGAGHTGGLAADPAGYERRVVGFFDQALRGP